MDNGRIYSWTPAPLGELDEFTSSTAMTPKSARGACSSSDRPHGKRALSLSDSSSFRWEADIMPRNKNAGGGRQSPRLGASHTHRPDRPMRSFKERTRGAIRIQASFRRWIGSRAFQSSRRAALMLQRWWRMEQCKARLRASLARLWWRLTMEVLQLDGAARRLQGGVRMVQLRQWRRLAVAAVKQLQPWWRGARVRLAVFRLLCAVLRLQRRYRRCRVQQVLKKRLTDMYREILEAAFLLQRVWRGAIPSSSFAISIFSVGASCLSLTPLRIIFSDISAYFPHKT